MLSALKITILVKWRKIKMLKLITLELKKNKIRSYIYAIGIITLCMLGFLYTFGMIAYLGGDADAIEFSTYSNIWTLTTALHTVS